MDFFPSIRKQTCGICFLTKLPAKGVFLYKKRNRVRYFSTVLIWVVMTGSVNRQGRVLCVIVYSTFSGWS